MTKDSLVDQLGHAADHVDELSRDELRSLLALAVERLSEADLEADYLALIREMNEAGQEPFGVNEVVKDWLVGHGKIPVLPIDEETETKGNA